jgi:hypothetical protein
LHCKESIDKAFWSARARGSCGKTFQRGAHDVHREDLVETHGPNDSAAVVRSIDQLLIGQVPQRLAHWRPAHPERSG